MHLILIQTNQKGKNVFRDAENNDDQEGSLKCEIKALSTFPHGRIEVTLPIRTVSEANSSEHWTKKHKRHKKQQFLVTLAIKGLKCKLTLPCEIKLTRYAPRCLDKHDNLPMSFKYILDCICGIITPGKKAGRADDDDRISVLYHQEKSKKYSIKIEITF